MNCETTIDFYIYFLKSKYNALCSKIYILAGSRLMGLD